MNGLLRWDAPDEPRGEPEEEMRLGVAPELLFAESETSRRQTG